MDMLTPPTVFPICTIANTPRLPEHCIEWASVLEWPKAFKGESPSSQSQLALLDLTVVSNNDRQKAR